MELPLFPDFRKVELSCKEAVKEILRINPLEASEYTFTNLFAFNSAYEFGLSVLDTNLIILSEADPFSFFCPVGNNNIPKVLDRLFDFLKEKTEEQFIERVPESFASLYMKNNAKYVALEDRDHFDYIYNVKELVDLKGRKFHDKKNKINKFKSSYDFEYLEMTPDIVDECLKFEEYWCEVKECDKYPGLERENCATIRMLKNFGSLNMKGGAIRVDGKIAAVTLGEKMLPDTFVVHVEKANPDLPGLYQLINQEFLISEAGDCRFVNREQDLGIKGLRKAKMSYKPAGFIKKYRVRKRI